jgi:ADP-heptose:LPS heptosyltransferase
LVGSLRRERFDLAVDFQGLIKSAFLARLSKARKVIGFPRSRLREKAARHFYTSTVPTEHGQRHQVEANLDLVHPPRFPEDASSLIPFAPPEPDCKYVDENLDQLEISRPILLNPGAGWETKRWAAGRFAELAVKIEEDLGLPTLFTYGPGEEHLIAEVSHTMGPDRVRSFPTSIVQLAALCQRSRMMIAGDTGPLHLAVALATPTVAILGPAFAWRTGPFNPQDKVVCHSRPCPFPYKRECEDHFCMDISAESVFAAVVQRLELKRLQGGGSADSAEALKPFN